MTSPAGLDAHLVVDRAPTFDLDVGLQLPGGRTTALLGPNGAGKSTVIAALAGLVPLDGGRITLDGRVLDDPGRGVFVPPARRRIGVVFQDGLLFDHLRVLDNVAFGPRSSGASRSESAQVAREWLARLGLAELARRQPGQLSGGQAQRVALARALASEPDLLLLDEPMSALDVTGRAGLRRTLADHLGSFAGPRLLITHDPVEAFLLADLVHVIEGGRITQTGSADEIRLAPRTPYAADLVGTNLLRGSASAGVVTTDTATGSTHRIHVADSTLDGPVLLRIHPRAVALHRRPPGGSPRNIWRTAVTAVEDLGDRVRLRVEEPLPLTVEVTPGAVSALGLEVGSTVWVAVKATEIEVSPQGHAGGAP